MGALLVGFAYEVNPQLGGPLLLLVILALLGAAYKAGNLSYTGAANWLNHGVSVGQTGSLVGTAGG